MRNELSMEVLLEQVAKRYAQNWVLREVDLTLDSGSTTALLGANGSGKSTLLRIIAGFLQSSKGSITYRLNGNAIPESVLYQHVSFVAPYLEIYDRLTLKEMLKLHGTMRSYRDGFNMERIIEELKLPADKELRTFSSGMLQRVKLALGLFTESDLYLFDEPSMNLDDVGTNWFLDQMKGLAGKQTIIIASNLPGVETGLCQQGYRISNSQLEAVEMRPSH